MKAFDDFVYLKKYYGENFAKFCRDNFQTILEEPGKLSGIISQNFAKTRCLYDDIVKRNYEYEFKSLIYFIYNEQNQHHFSNKSPFELFKEAGYTLYKCENFEDVKSFEKYWDESEKLCTFNNIENKLDECIVFFAVKDGAENLMRSNYENPQRQDEYGTSVISIQFEKFPPHIIKICNRYNHSVKNPDATFGNNLDNIVLGLNNSFHNYLKASYGFNFDYKKKIFDLEGYVLADDKKFYKVNYVLNGKCYCADNYIIDNKTGMATRLSPDKYLVFDYFILDLENKKFVTDLFDLDGFTRAYKNIKKVDITTHKDKKFVQLYTNTTGNNPTILVLNSANQIVELHDSTLVEAPSNYLRWNQTVKTASFSNLQVTNYSFFEENLDLEQLITPKLIETQTGFVKSNEILTVFEAPNVKRLGNYSFHSNSAIKRVEFDKLESMGHNCYSNANVEEIILPKCKKMGIGCFSKTQKIKTVYLPEVLSMGMNCFCENNSIEDFITPKLEEIQANVLMLNKVLKTFYVPQIPNSLISPTILSKHPNRNALMEHRIILVEDIKENCFTK